MMTRMTVIVSVVNLTSLEWVISRSVGLKLASKSVVRANEATAAARQMNSVIEHERIFLKKSQYLG